MRNPESVRKALRTRFDAALARWLAHPAEASFALPLHPPTAAVALAAPDTVSAWTEAWRSAPQPLRDGVLWEERRWAQLGTQHLPARWEGSGADRLAHCAGPETARAWQVLSARVETATSALDAAIDETRSPDNGRGSEDARDGRDSSTLRAGIASAIAGLRGRWLEMSAVDADLTIRAASWFLAHPDSGVRIRQVPLPGMHTKWLQAHRAVVERLVAAAREDGSAELGLAPAPVFHDVLVLDPALRGVLRGADPARGDPDFSGGPPHEPVTALPRSSRIDIAELAAVGLSPSVVIVCENAETVQVLPDIPGAVALSGAGYSVPALLKVPWVQATPVLLYWGDLDADGFRILDRARHHHPQVRSVLMDRRTLDTHRQLVVHGGTRTSAATTMLECEERALHDELAASGERLEQERIELGYAVSALRMAAGEVVAESARRV